MCRGELRHECRQSPTSIFWERVVNRRSDAAHAPVTLQIVHVKGFRCGNKRSVDLWRWGGEWNVHHAAAIWIRVGGIEAVRVVDGIVNQARLFLIVSFHRIKAAAVENPLKDQSGAIHCKDRWRVVSRALVCMNVIPKHCRQIRVGVRKQIFMNDDQRDACWPNVLLGSGIHHGMGTPVDWSTEDVAAHVCNERGSGRWGRVPSRAVDRVVRAIVGIGSVVRPLNLRWRRDSVISSVLA